MLSSLPSEQFLDLHELDFLLGQSSFDYIQNVIQRKARIPLCDLRDPRYEKVNEVSKRLRKISRTERFVEEERGSRDLYIGYPFIKGKLADGTPIHAPLLFFPVTLHADREQWCLAERDETGIILNRSFALAYSHFNEITIDDDILEKSFEDFSKDALEFRTQLYEWLKETQFRINFNQQLFENKLDAFAIQKSADLEKSEKNGELKLFPEAVLGIFPQAGSYLVPDYNTLLERSEKAGNDLLLLDDPDLEPKEHVNPEDRSVILKEEEILTPFSVDESQEEIIRAVKLGKSVVVQGPPGSGKSQLICNLMADFASRGKRVLLVCQKRAALDVVFQRLQTIGMQPFVALIHDFKNDRAELYRQVATQIEQVEAYRKQNYGLDAVFLERQFIQESRHIDKTVEALQNFRSALFDENECGVSVKELYLTSDPAMPSVDAGEWYRSFRPDSWDDYSRRLNTYGGYTFLISEKHPWTSRKSFAAFGLNDLLNIERMLGDWPDAFARQTSRFEEITDKPFSSQYLAQSAESIERLEMISGLVTTARIYDMFRAFLNSDHNPNERVAFVRQTADALEGYLAEDGLELTLSNEELPPFRMLLKTAVNAKQSAVSGLWWDLFGGDKKTVAFVAEQNGLKTTPEDLVKLERRVRNRLELEGWLTDPLLGLEPGQDGLRHSGDEGVLDFFKDAEKGADAAVAAGQWLDVLKHLSEYTSDAALFRSFVDKLVAWLRSWDRMEAAMAPYLLKSQIASLIAEPVTYSTTLLEAVQRDFDSLVDMDKIWQQMTTAEQVATQAVLVFKSKTENVSAVEMVAVFQNGVRLAWINHIENRFPDLRAVTSLKMQQWEEQLQKGITQKQLWSSDIAGINLRERTYEDVEKNRLGNRVTYRELSHQVTKKRKIWPIRKLLEAHAGEVFSLIPCWMASPESVSAMFPMEAGLFDLVIFDEASQCYAEYGLPASFRGKQIVVTGDSKQLPPSDLYRIRFDDKTEEEIPVAMEIESLLDLAAQALDQYQLSGHYRSLSLDLIDFSNKHFYKNSLRLLPDFKGINNQNPGIHYVKVDGVWKGNTNLIEAEKVISLLRELEQTGLSVGVVTFNFNQQQLIQEVVEKEGIAPKSLFVKNIENVQGDERDVIIFTMAYAPDEKGKISMQFGSLNMQGGENRLNVAVTRARERIFFITSLLPSQLDTDQAANAGPRLLKAYMQYAYDVSAGHYRPKPFQTGLLRSQWLLKDRLADQQPDLEKELPFADLTIKEGSLYKGLVLTDDDQYHFSKSSKEPHAYLPLLLKLKNWPFKRVYSRELWAGKLNLEKENEVTRH